MKTSLGAGAKISLLRAIEILNKENVARVLGITERSAANLLLRWTNEGALVRIAPGRYTSIFSEHDQDQLRLQSLVNCVGKNFILVGASSWNKVGWCDSKTLHVAIPWSPSRRVPRIHNAVLYPVGAKVYSHLLKATLQMEMDKPPLLHPSQQMLWWMNIGCPIEMPSPDRINWNAIRAEPDVALAMCQHWEELKGQEKDLDVELLYRMLHLDRLQGRTPGRAEAVNAIASEPGQPDFTDA